MSSQTRLESAVETTLNIGSGFIISLLMWILVVGPLYGIETHFSENLGITAIFTVTSVIRSYVWRRLFNRFHIHEHLHRWVTRHFVAQ